MTIIIKTAENHKIFINNFVHFIHTPTEQNEQCYYIFLDNDLYYLVLLDKRHNVQNKKAYNDYLNSSRTTQITLYACRASLRSRLKDKISKSHQHNEQRQKKECNSKSKTTKKPTTTDKFCQVLDKYEELRPL